MPVRHANDLQTVHVDLLIVKYADAGGGDGSEIFAIVSKLLVISRDKIDAVWRREFTQRLRGAFRVNGRAVIQITGNENRVRFFAQDRRNQASPEPPVAHVAQDNIADHGALSH